MHTARRNMGELASHGVPIVERFLSHIQNLPLDLYAPYLRGGQAWVCALKTGQ